MEDVTAFVGDIWGSLPLFHWSKHHKEQRTFYNPGQDTDPDHLWTDKSFTVMLPLMLLGKMHRCVPNTSKCTRSLLPLLHLGAKHW